MHRRLILSASLATAALAFAPHAGKAADVPPAPPEAPEAPKAAFSVTEVTTSFALPTKSGRGGGPTPYKFDELAAPTVNEKGEQVLASFGVVGKTKANLSSTVHTANKNTRTNLYNADGSAQMAVKKVKGRDVPYHAFSQAKKFEAFDVNEAGGITVRVFRTK